jgi:hypothetical protein
MAPGITRCPFLQVMFLSASPYTATQSAFVIAMYRVLVEKFRHSRNDVRTDRKRRSCHIEIEIEATTFSAPVRLRHTDFSHTRLCLLLIWLRQSERKRRTDLMRSRVETRVP